MEAVLVADGVQPQPPKATDYAILSGTQDSDADLASACVDFEASSGGAADTDRQRLNPLDQRLDLQLLMKLAPDRTFFPPPRLPADGTETRLTGLTTVEFYRRRATLQHTLRRRARAIERWALMDAWADTFAEGAGLDTEFSSSFSGSRQLFSDLAAKTVGDGPSGPTLAFPRLANSSGASAGGPVDLPPRNRVRPSFSKMAAPPPTGGAAQDLLLRFQSHRAESVFNVFAARSRVENIAVGEAALVVLSALVAGYYYLRLEAPNTPLVSRMSLEYAVQTIVTIVTSSHCFSVALAWRGEPCRHGALRFPRPAEDNPLAAPSAEAEGDADDDRLAVLARHITSHRCCAPGCTCGCDLCCAAATRRGNNAQAGTSVKLGRRCAALAALRKQYTARLEAREGTASAGPADAPLGRFDRLAARAYWLYEPVATRFYNGISAQDAAAVPSLECRCTQYGTVSRLGVHQMLAASMLGNIFVSCVIGALFAAMAQFRRQGIWLHGAMVFVHVSVIQPPIKVGVVAVLLQWVSTIVTLVGAVVSATGDPGRWGDPPEGFGADLRFPWGDATIVWPRAAAILVASAGFGAACLIGLYGSEKSERRRFAMLVALRRAQLALRRQQREIDIFTDASMPPQALVRLRGAESAAMATLADTVAKGVVGVVEVVDFRSWSTSVLPGSAVMAVHRMLVLMDKFAVAQGVQKAMTANDRYVVVAGLITLSPSPQEARCEATEAARQALAETRRGIIAARGGSPTDAEVFLEATLKFARTAVAAAQIIDQSVQTAGSQHSRSWGSAPSSTGSVPQGSGHSGSGRLMEGYGAGFQMRAGVASGAVAGGLVGSEVAMRYVVSGPAVACAGACARHALSGTVGISDFDAAALVEHTATPAVPPTPEQSDGGPRADDPAANSAPADKQLMSPNPYHFASVSPVVNDLQPGGAPAAAEGTAPREGDAARVVRGLSPPDGVIENPHTPCLQAVPSGSASPLRACLATREWSSGTSPLIGMGNPPPHGSQQSNASGANPLYAGGGNLAVAALEEAAANPNRLLCSNNSRREAGPPQARGSAAASGFGMSRIPNESVVDLAPSFTVNQADMRPPRCPPSADDRARKQRFAAGKPVQARASTPVRGNSTVTVDPVVTKDSGSTGKSVRAAFQKLSRRGELHPAVVAILTARESWCSVRFDHPMVEALSQVFANVDDREVLPSGALLVAVAFAAIFVGIAIEFATSSAAAADDTAPVDVLSARQCGDRRVALVLALLGGALMLQGLRATVWLRERRGAEVRGVHRWYSVSAPAAVAADEALDTTAVEPRVEEVTVAADSDHIVVTAARTALAHKNALTQSDATTTGMASDSLRCSTTTLPSCLSAATWRPWLVFGTDYGVFLVALTMGAMACLELDHTSYGVAQSLTAIGVGLPLTHRLSTFAPNWVAYAVPHAVLPIVLFGWLAAGGKTGQGRISLPGELPFVEWNATIVDGKTPVQGGFVPFATRTGQSSVFFLGNSILCIVFGFANFRGVRRRFSLAARAEALLHVTRERARLHMRVARALLPAYGAEYVAKVIATRGANAQVESSFTALAPDAVRPCPRLVVAALRCVTAQSTASPFDAHSVSAAFLTSVVRSCDRHGLGLVELIDTTGDTALLAGPLHRPEERRMHPSASDSQRAGSGPSAGSGPRGRAPGRSAEDDIHDAAIACLRVVANLKGVATGMDSSVASSRQTDSSRMTDVGPSPLSSSPSTTVLANPPSCQSALTVGSAHAAVLGAGLVSFSLIGPAVREATAILDAVPAVASAFFVVAAPGYRKTFRAAQMQVEKRLAKKALRRQKDSVPSAGVALDGGDDMSNGAAAARDKELLMQMLMDRSMERPGAAGPHGLVAIAEAVADSLPVADDVGPQGDDTFAPPLLFRLRGSGIISVSVVRSTALSTLVSTADLGVSLMYGFSGSASHRPSVV